MPTALRKNMATALSSKFSLTPSTNKTFIMTDLATFGPVVLSSRIIPATSSDPSMVCSSIPATRPFQNASAFSSSTLLGFSVKLKWLPFWWRSPQLDGAPSRAIHSLLYGTTACSMTLYLCLVVFAFRSGGCLLADRNVLGRGRLQHN